MWGRVGLLLIKEIKSPLNIRSNQAFELKKREDKKKNLESHGSVACSEFPAVKCLEF